MSPLFLIGVSSVMNRVRGANVHSIPTTLIRAFSVACTSAAAGWYAQGQLYSESEVYVIAGTCHVGLIFWFIWGWGKYFSAFHGRDNPSEQEVRWIDRLGYAVFPYQFSPLNYVAPGTGLNRKRGLLMMSLRGLYLLPLFAVLAGYCDPHAWWVCFVVLLQGPIYALMRYLPERHATEIAELLQGALIGFCLTQLI